MARSVRANVIANYVGAGWSALMGFAFVPLYIHYLGIEAYGLIGVFAVLQAWLSLLDFGLAQTLSREMARLHGGAQTAQSIRNLLRSIEVLYLLIAVTIAASVWAGAGFLAENWLNARDLPIPIVSQALAITGLVIAFRWLGGLYRSAIVGLQEHVALNAVGIMFSTFRGAGVLMVLAFVSPTIIAFFLFQGVLAALEALALFVLVHQLTPKAPARAKFQLSTLRGVGRFALGIAMITLLSLLLMQTDKIVLAGLLTLEEFGYYVLAGTAASAISMFAGPVATAVGPKLTELVAGSSGATLAGAYHRYSQLLALVVVPVGALAVFFPDYLLVLWTHDLETTNAVAPILSVLALGTTFNSLMYVPYLLQIAHGWTRFMVTINIVAVAVLVPVLLVVTPMWGGIGAAMVWAVLNVSYVLIAVPLMHRRLLVGEQLSWYLVDIGPICVVVAILAFLIRMIAGLPILQQSTFNMFVVLSAGFLFVTSSAMVSPFGREVLFGLLQRTLECFRARSRWR